jgi:hypothetical protein
VKKPTTLSINHISTELPDPRSPLHRTRTKTTPKFNKHITSIREGKPTPKTIPKFDPRLKHTNDCSIASLSKIHQKLIQNSHKCNAKGTLNSACNREQQRHDDHDAQLSKQAGFTQSRGPTEQIELLTSSMRSNSLRLSAMGGGWGCYASAPCVA